MKMYTTPKQTAKLTELGFEKPWRNEYLHILEEYGYAVEEARNFSIGELIEMLPPRYNHEDLEINRDWRFERWVVFYRGDDTTAATELVDALYDMIVKLKIEE